MSSSTPRSVWDSDDPDPPAVTTDLLERSDPGSPDHSDSGGPGAARDSGPGLWARLRAAMPPALFGAGTIVFWYLMTLVVPDRKKILLPAPHEVVGSLISERSDLLDALVITAKESLTGLLVAGIIGVLVAVIMSQGRFAERALFPWAVVLQTVPTLALVPLIGLWFGFGFRSRVIVVVLIALFPIITNTHFGLTTVDANLHDMFTLHRVGRARRLWRLQFPAAMPAIFAGFRISAGLSVIGAIVGEFFFGRGDKGLGNLVDRFRGQLDMPALYATIAVSSVLGIAVYWTLAWAAERYTGAWHETGKKAE
ncbi:MAG TPA: ABC transporter permease [Acidimicrobiales bacterium]|nr:ABC transporter permease [Acidimicrobiales bacterium]